MRLLLLLLGAALLACSRPHYKNLPPRTGETWIAFGDSLTAGTGAEPGRDYPTVLGDLLGVPILNLGKPGDTTAAALGRLERALDENPRVVLLCLGGNDTLQRVPLADTIANLETIIDRFHAHGAFVVLIGIRSTGLVDRFHRPLARLARRKRVLYVPNLLAGVLGQPSLMADAIHPNEAGYERIAHRLADQLRPYLTELTASPQPG